MTISPLAVIAVFAFGLMVGSFLNVCIWRIPRGEQIVKGRSRCTHCKKQILWHDNIPLLSFCLLKGRCRFCKRRIAWRYPLVELVSALLWVGVVIRFGWTPLAAAYGVLAALLLALAVIDAREMILPDEITLPGVSLGVILSYYLPQMQGAASRWAGLWASVLGALVGAAVIWMVGFLGRLAFKREAMGMGDVKLMAMVGAWIGLVKVLMVDLLFGPILGALVGVVLKYRYGRDLIPYGPFLAAGTGIALFWGDSLVRWYLSGLRI